MQAGRLLIAAGLGLVVMGALSMLASKAGVKLFRLPGDVVWKGEHTTIYLPIATSILLSVLLTVVLWLLRYR